MVGVLVLLCVVSLSVIRVCTGYAQGARNEFIEGLLTRYGADLRKAGLSGAFETGVATGEPANLTEPQRRLLTALSERFLSELAGKGYTVNDLRDYKADARNKHGQAGERGTGVGQAWWEANFLATERALSLGRISIVQGTWEQGLTDYLSGQPAETVATVYGEMDIGKWVTLEVGRLTFEGDVDLSSLTSDPVVNKAIEQFIERRLVARTKLGMTGINAIITPHGQGGAEVYIGKWGAKWAELDLLKRGKCKLIKTSQSAEGTLQIEFIETTGERLLWERALREGKAYEPPRITLADEPGISLELNRHMVIEVQLALRGQSAGPYSAAAAAIKAIKLASRSYITAQKALSEFGWDPYVSNKPELAAAIRQIEATTDPVEQAKILEALTGGKLNGTASEADAMQVISEVVRQTQEAMANNSAKGLAMRLLKVSEMGEGAARETALRDLWSQMRAEIRQYNAGHPPQALPEQVAKILELGLRYDEGKLSPAEQVELKRLISELDAKMTPGILERVFGGDAVLALKKYLREKLGWIPEHVDAFAEKAAKRFPNLTEAHKKIQRFNERMETTMNGSKLIRAAEWAFLSFAVYDAYCSAPTEEEAWMAAAKETVVMAAVMSHPAAWIPVSLVDAYKQGSVKPLGMGFLFYYMPWTFKFYAVMKCLERMDASLADKAFANAVADMLGYTEFGGDLTAPRIIQFRSDVEGRDPVDISPPGDRDKIIEAFNDPTGWLSGSSTFRYWRNLIPDTQFNPYSYNRKLAAIRSYFPGSRELADLTHVLEAVAGNTDPGKMPVDQWTKEREECIGLLTQSLEDALWRALADTLEAAIKGCNEDPLKAEIARLEDELWFKKGALQAEIDKQKRMNYSAWANLVHGEGNKVWVVGFIYDKFISTYKAILETRKTIMTDLWWKVFDIDVERGQSAPLKILLSGQGQERSAPLLTGDYTKDLEASQKCMKAHGERAKKVAADFIDATGRPGDPTKDKGHLRFLGQLAFEMEHLVDAAPGRALADLGQAESDAWMERGKQYNAYLAMLNLKPKIDGERKANTNQQVTLKAVVEGDDKYKQWLPERTLEWTTDKDPEPVGDTEEISYTPHSGGVTTVRLVVSGRIGDQTVAMPEVTHQLTVGEVGRVTFDVEGPTQAKMGTALSFSPRITAGDPKTVEGLHWVWTLFGLADSERKQETVQYTVPRKGDYQVQLEMWSKTKDGDRRLDYVTRPLKIDDLDRTIVVTAPKEVMYSDIFQVTATLPKDIQAQAKVIDWYPSPMRDPAKPNEVPTGTTAAMQFVPWRSMPEEPAYYTVTATAKTDARGESIGTGGSKVIVKPARLSGSGSGAWEGGSSLSGFTVTRKTATRKRSEGGKEFDSASVSATVSATWGEIGFFGERTLESLREEVAKYAQPDEVKAIAIADFKGFVREKPFTAGYRGNEWGYVDVAYPEASASASGWVIKGNQMIAVSWWVSGGGYRGGVGPRYWWDDMPFVRSQVKAAEAECRAIVGSLTISPTGTFTTKPYEGPSLDGTDLPVVKISPEKKTVRLDEITEFTAIVENARPEDLPLTYEWPEGSNAKGDKAFWQAPASGKHEVWVAVTGANGFIGTATASIEAEDIRAVVTKVEPADDKITVGRPVTLKATVTSSGKPLAGEFVYRWEPLDALEFAPQETGEATTKVAFTEPGRNKVFVSALQKRGETLTTLATSDTLELEIIKPGLTIALTPEKPFIGQTVTAKVATDPPDVRDVDFRWELDAANAQQVGESGDGREITFIPKTIDEVKLAVNARVPGTGEDLGRAESALTAQEMKVTATVLGPSGPKPMVWNPQKGLVEEAVGIAVHQHVKLKAEIDPQPEKTPLTFRWTLNDDSHFAGNDTGAEVTVYRSQVGACVAKVEAEDGYGLKLGRAEATFGATVSQQQIDEGKARNQLALKVEAASAKDPVILGKPAKFRAVLTQAGKPATGSFIYRWHPVPDVAFNPREAVAPATEAVFKVAGDARVWVEVLRSNGGTDTGAAATPLMQSDPLTVKVLAPNVVLALTPAKAYTGEESAAKVTLDPDVPDDVVDFRWKLSANVAPVEAPGDTREIRFLPQDTKQATVTVELVVGGKVVGNAVQTLLAVSRDEEDRPKRAAETLAEAKEKARRGNLDDAVTAAGEAAKMDPQNADAAAYAKKLEQEHKIVTEQLAKTKQLMEEAEFEEAQKALIVAQNLHGNYPPVVEAHAALGDAWRKHDTDFRDRLFEVAEASKAKDFQKALDLAGKMRAEMKLQAFAIEQVTQQENWARQWLGEKQKAQKTLAAGEEQLKQHDYTAAAETFRVGLANAANVFGAQDPEPNKYNALLADAVAKEERIGELGYLLSNAVGQCNGQLPTATALEGWIKAADEAVALQPADEKLPGVRTMLATRLQWRKEMDAETGRIPDVFRVEGRTWGALLTSQYPRSFCRLSLTFRYYEPGTILDMAGIGGAGQGCFSLAVGEDGVVRFNIYDARTKSPFQLERSVWHSLPSEAPVALGVDHRVVIEHWGDHYRMTVDDQATQRMDIPVRLAGTEVWVGDTPADTPFGEGRNIHPAMIGIVKDAGFEPIDDITPYWGRPYLLENPSDGGVLTSSYPKQDIKLVMVLNYTKPGTLLGTPQWVPKKHTVGSFNLAILPDGRLSFGIGNATHVPTAPRFDLPESRNPISAGENHVVVITLAAAGGYSLYVDDDIDSGANLPGGVLNGDPIYLGAIPGGRGAVVGDPNYPGFVGKAYIKYFGSADGQSPAVLEPELLPGAPPRIEPSQFEVVMCEKVTPGGGTPEGAADSFAARPSVTALVRYADIPEGTVIYSDWERDGQKLTTSDSGVVPAAGRGWFQFGLSPTGGLAPGEYVVTVRTDTQVLGQKTFTIVPGQPAPEPRLDLVLCESVQDGRPVNVAESFRGPKAVVLYGTSSGFPEGTVLEVVWEKDGQVLVRDTHTVGQETGLIKLEITSDTALPAGKYTVSLNRDGAALWRKSFTAETVATAPVVQPGASKYATRSWDVVSLSVPDDWTEDNTAKRGAWYRGAANDPEVSFTATRAATLQTRLDEIKAGSPDMQVTSQGASTVAGKSAISYEMLLHGGARKAWLLYIKDTTDGTGNLCLQFTAPAAAFEGWRSVFMRMQASVKLAAKAAPVTPPATPPKVPSGRYTADTPNLADLHPDAEEYPWPVAIRFVVSEDGTVSGGIDTDALIARLKQIEGFKSATFPTNKVTGTMAGAGGKDLTARLSFTTDMAFTALGMEFKGQIIVDGQFQGTRQADGRIAGRARTDITTVDADGARATSAKTWDFTALRGERGGAAGPAMDVTAPSSGPGSAVSPGEGWREFTVGRMTLWIPPDMDGGGGPDKTGDPNIGYWWNLDKARPRQVCRTYLGAKATVSKSDVEPEDYPDIKVTALGDTQLGGEPASAFVLSSAAKDFKQWVLILKTPEAGSKYLSVYFESKASQWDSVSSTFHKIAGLLKLAEG